MHAFSFSHHQRHSHTTQTPKENVCVCVCVCVFVCVIAEKRRAVAERVSLWAGFLDQTATCRLGKHQSKCLCRTADSPATARTLQDHLHQPTDKVSTCGLEKYMPLKQRKCHTLCRTQFDGVGYFTSMHDVFHGELLHRSTVRSVHGEVTKAEDTVVGLHRQGLLVLVGKLCGGRANRRKRVLVIVCRLRSGASRLRR